VRGTLAFVVVLLAACGAASSSRPVVSAAEASRREACTTTRERWNIARVQAMSSGTSPHAYAIASGEPCQCGNGKIDTCTTHDRDCPRGNPHACDGVPIVERSFSDACDGKDLGGMTCERLGFAGGALSCTASCVIDTSACEWLPANAKSVPLSARETLTAMIANDDDELLVITAPLQKTSPITARRYDRDLHAVAETTLEGSFDGVAAIPHGFVVAVRDDLANPRKGAIYDVANPTPLFAFADGRVVSLWTVRGQDKTLRDPIALLTQTTGAEQVLRVRRGAQPVTTDARPTAQWNAEAVETPSGIVLPAGLFEPLVRVKSDGTSEEVAGPEACPVHATYAPGWLVWASSDMHPMITPVDDALRPRGTGSSLGAPRLDAPVFLGDWLWLGKNDFVRRDAGATIVHLARGPVEPMMLTPFAGALAIVWNRGPSAITLVPFP
jgi:hypothetical protein